MKGVNTAVLKVKLNRVLGLCAHICFGLVYISCLPDTADCYKVGKYLHLHLYYPQQWHEYMSVYVQYVINVSIKEHQ